MVIWYLVARNDGVCFLIVGCVDNWIHVILFKKKSWTTPSSECPRYHQAVVCPDQTDSNPLGVKTTFLSIQGLWKWQCGVEPNLHFYDDYDNWPEVRFKAISRSASIPPRPNLIQQQSKILLYSELMGLARLVSIFNWKGKQCFLLMTWYVNWPARSDFEWVVHLTDDQPSRRAEKEQL